MKIGVISDTHGWLDPRVEKIFAGVKHILHAGDFGHATLILELQFIAPVTAVLGNCDNDPGYRLTETIELARKKFLIHHIVNPHALTHSAAEVIAKAAPHAVIFGHTHKRLAETVNGIFFFNPGYAGKPRFGLQRTLAILHSDPDGIHPEFLPL